MAPAEKTTSAAGLEPERTLHPVRAWLAVVVAALAMVATLPGRTHGLGLITESLLADLQLDRVTFALINLWATLLGATFCLPTGWLLDRVGGRVVLLGVTLGLAATVVGMGQAGAGWGDLLLPGLFALVLLTRGLGQSALSVVSLALMGRSVGRKPGLGVGVYSFVTALGFMAAFGVIKYVLEKWEPGWRPVWCGIGAAVAAFGLAAFVVVRPSQRAAEKASDLAPDAVGLSLGQTLMTPAFWVFAGATSLYGMVAAGVSLFNQSILEERQFDRGVFLTITMLSPLVGLAANLATGWLSRWVAPGRLLSLAMLLLTAALLCFPLVRSLWQVYLYAAAMGVAGGMVTVIFFGVWGQAFGTAHLGKIQGAAQMLTVPASAAGPLLLAAGQRAFGSYVPVFQYVAAVVALFGVAAWLVPLPRVGCGAAPAAGSDSLHLPPRMTWQQRPSPSDGTLTKSEGLSSSEDSSTRLR
jgi:MFS family permease